MGRYDEKGPANPSGTRQAMDKFRVLAGRPDSGDGGTRYCLALGYGHGPGKGQDTGESTLGSLGRILSRWRIAGDWWRRRPVQSAVLGDSREPWTNPDDGPERLGHPLCRVFSSWRYVRCGRTAGATSSVRDSHLRIGPESVARQRPKRQCRERRRHGVLTGWGVFRRRGARDGEDVEDRNMGGGRIV